MTDLNFSPLSRAGFETETQTGVEVPGLSLGQLWRRFRQNRLAVLGLAILGVIFAGAILAPVITPGGPLEMDLLSPLQPPFSPGHPLGTDNFGRDLMARIFFGARISLTVGFVVVGISAAVGLVAGLLSGYYGGWVDQLVMRITDIFFAFPFFILAIGVIAVLGPNIINVMAVLGLVTWPEYARLVRGQVLSIKQETYVDAARTLGANDWRIMFRHILPNCLAPVIVLATVGMASAILSAAGLSFLGMGVQPPSPEWGAMLNEGKTYMMTAPHLIVIPGFAIMVTVLALNFVGDGLRDALDPRLDASKM